MEERLELKRKMSIEASRTNVDEKDKLIRSIEELDHLRKSIKHKDMMIMAGGKTQNQFEEYIYRKGALNEEESDTMFSGDQGETP